MNKCYNSRGNSLQELLCQFFTKINECIDDVNKYSELVENLLTWIETEGLGEEVIKILKKWWDDGKFSEILTKDVLQEIDKRITLLEKTSDEFITPEMFGAKGDATNDDTEALKKAIKEARVNNKKILFKNKYRITNTLYEGTGKEDELFIKFVGFTNYRPIEWNLKTGLLLEGNFDLFKNCKLCGFISNLYIKCKSPENTINIFKNIELANFLFNNNTVIDAQSITNDGLCSTAKFIDCSLMGIKNFSKSESDKEVYFTDSLIRGCYIQGKLKENNEGCFEFSSYNGSIIINNFIDFYNTIYKPKTGFTDGPVSIGNHYQVFRYLISSRGAQTYGMSFSSNSDIFNWTKESSHEFLRRQVPIKYTKKDGSTDNVPPCVFWIVGNKNITMTNATFQGNIDNVAFIQDSLDGQNAMSKIEIAQFNKSFPPKISYNDFFYNHSNKITMSGIETPFVKKFDSLPNIKTLKMDVYLGQVIMVENKFYKLVKDADVPTYYVKWERVYNLNSMPLYV